MYKCDCCGNIFEEPARWREERSGDGWAYETMTGSPCCKDGYTEVHECETCINLIPLYDDFCEECEREIDNLMQEAQVNGGYDYETFCKLVDHWRGE